jgi:hypothetical protein
VKAVAKGSHIKRQAVSDIIMFYSKQLCDGRQRRSSAGAWLSVLRAIDAVQHC